MSETIGNWLDKFKFLKKRYENDTDSIIIFDLWKKAINDAISKKEINGYIMKLRDLDEIYDIPIYIQALSCNLYPEYLGLKLRKDRDDFSEGRLIIFKSVIKMIEKDPILGDVEDHKNLSDDIRKGGEYLNNHGGDSSMRDYMVWSFIPKKMHRFIDHCFNNIGEWQA